MSDLALTFPIDSVEQELALAKASKPNRDGKHGMALVGDRGVYLMAWCERPALQTEADKKDGYKVVYATQCDPTTNQDWYNVKRTVFGGDDGVFDLSIAKVENWIARNRKGGRKNLKVVFTHATDKMHINGAESVSLR